MKLFKSKGFTAGFIVLSVLILVLSAALIYLVVNRKSGKTERLLTGKTEAAQMNSEETVPETESETPKTEPETESETETTETEETTEETTESETEPVDSELRALRSDEEHVCPVVNSLIYENGVASIVKPGDSGEGITFHKEPKFDAADASGNVTNYDGAYDTNAKIFITEGEEVYLMYKTLDDYYVTGSRVYIDYQCYNGKKVDLAGANLVTYGASQAKGILVKAMQDDGNHVAFNVYSFDSSDGATETVLKNVIGVYGDDGVAKFEYHNTDGHIYTGTIQFGSQEMDGVMKQTVRITFPGAVTLAGHEISDITLTN